MKNKFFILIFLALLLSSCVSPGQTEYTADQVKTNQKFVEDHTIRTIDTQAGVVCWIYFATGGISCLPISQTKLDNKNENSQNRN